MSAGCRSCGAPVEWAMFASGKSSPFERDESGQWAIAAGKAHKYTDDDAALHRERWSSHFAKCPQASNWRTK